MPDQEPPWSEIRALCRDYSVYFVACFYLPPHTADELGESVVHEVYEAFSASRNPCRNGKWKVFLFCRVKYRAINRWRQQCRRTALESQIRSPRPVRSPEEESVLNEVRSRIGNWQRNLSPHDAFIVQSKIYGLTAYQIALNLAEGTPPTAKAINRIESIAYSRFRDLKAILKNADLLDEGILTNSEFVELVARMLSRRPESDHTQLRMAQENCPYEHATQGSEE